MSKPGTKFQCYLAVGKSQEVETESQKIAKNHGVNLDKISPDIFEITPQKQSISIEEVRNLKKHIFQKPVESPYKTIIFHQAHKLTIEAQNALLKILEEPPREAIIILESENKENILPTIRSRVIILELKKAKIKETDFYLNHSLTELLECLPSIDNSLKWLDTQIEIAHGEITKNAKNSKIPTRQITVAIEACIVAKKMISANVNPTFVLANLYLQTAK